MTTISKQQQSAYTHCRRCGTEMHPSALHRSWGLCWYSGSRQDGTDKSSDCAYQYSLYSSAMGLRSLYSDPRHQPLIDAWFESGCPFYFRQEAQS